MACGKFMFPQRLVDARRRLQSGDVSSEQLHEVETECLRDLVRRQTEAGLQIVSDGCITRTQWDFDFYFGLDGVERRYIESGHIYQDCDLHHPVPCITGAIGFNDAHPFFSQYMDLASMALAGVETSVLLPAPAHFLLWLLMQDGTWKSVYSDFNRLLGDISRTYNETILKFYGLGCRHIILEDRSWRMLCHRDGLKRILQAGYDLHQLTSSLRRVNDEALQQLPAGLDIMLYVKRLEVGVSREMASRHCCAISQIVFGHSNVPTVILDMPDGSEDSVMSIISHLPADKRLVIGVVDGRSPQLENMDEVAAKIRAARQMIGDSLRGITVIGGFKRESSSISTTAFLEDDQWQKISLLRRLADAV